MKTEPVFCGKIHITAVKNEKWFWYDYKTSKNDDKKILELVKSFCPEKYTVDRQPISEKVGEMFRSVIEKATGEKLDIPKDSMYSVTHAQDYNPVKKRDSHSILLFCQEKVGDKKTIASDRTAIDIYI